MSCLSIKVEVNNGSSIELAGKDAIALAIKLGICVEFRFNEVACFAYPDGSCEKLVASYLRATKPDTHLKVAFS